MKTPREILLARHRAAEPKLDAIREKVTAALNVPEKQQRSQTFLESLRAFFRLPPLAWGALAAVWLVIISLNIAARDESPRRTVPAQQAKRSADTLQALREQKRLFAEMVGAVVENPEADTKRFVPRPRSERSVEAAVA